MLTVIIVLCAVFVDFLLGEPGHYHPLAGFSRLVSRVEKRLVPLSGRSQRHFQLAGMLGGLVLVLPFVTFACWLTSLPAISVLASIAGLYLALGGHSLAEHALTVQAALEAGNLRYARERVAMMVNRGCRDLDEVAVIRATIESVLRNGNYAVYAAIFWFVLLGLPGVILYRLTNTLNGLWNIESERYADLGYTVHQMAKVLNWIPARLTALTYVLLGGVWCFSSTWAIRARQWKNRNDGWLIACGAGAMAIKLGGPIVVHGREQIRPWLGKGNSPSITDIGRSIRFIQQGLWLWLGIIFLGGWLTV